MKTAAWPASIDWATASAFATAIGTLVLAFATFYSVRSSNRSARVAERALLAGLRPVLMPSRLQDPPEKISFVDGRWLRVDGGHAAVEIGDDAVYLAISLRNAGSGIAVLHGWCLRSPEDGLNSVHADLDRFRRLSRDIFVPPGDIGFWQGALRDRNDGDFAPLERAASERTLITVELLYGDHEGGQRAISRFRLAPMDTGGWLSSVSRHWNIDRPDPR